MSTLFDSVIEATSQGPKVVSEQNDTSQIAVGQIDWAKRLTDRIAGVRKTYDWDANEMGVSLETAIARIEAADTPEARELVMAEMVQRALRRANLHVNADGKVCVVVAGEPPWHTLGTNVTEAMTSGQALEWGGLAGWDLRKIAAYIDWNGTRVENGRYSIVRWETGKVLGNVGKIYQIVSNEDCFAFMDALVSDGTLKYESAGAIGDGSEVWMLAKMPESFEAADGDQVDNYALLSASHDGTRAIKVLPTTHRVVCANTHRVALAGGCERTLSIHHNSSVMKNLARAREALGLVQESQEDYANKVKGLVSTPLPEPERYFDVCLDDVLNVTVAGQRVTKAGVDDGTVLKAIMDVHDVEQQAKERKKLDRYVSKRESLLADILDRYHSDRCNGLESIEGSAWAAYNAVSEAADHSTTMFRYNAADNRKRQETRFNSQLRGRADEIKQTAFEHVLALA